jgi:hypothetical protein
VLHPDDQPQTVSVRPPLDAREVDLVAGLAGAGRSVRQVWPGQPGPRSPWLPCADGCCLVAEPRPDTDPVGWLRFLVREILAPRAVRSWSAPSGSGCPGVTGCADGCCSTRRRRAHG